MPSDTRSVGSLCRRALFNDFFRVGDERQE